VSIKQKLFIAFLLVSIVPILVVAGLIFSKARSTLKDTQLVKLEAIADLKVREVEHLFEGLNADMRIAQDYFNIKSNLPVLTKFAGDRTGPEYREAEKRLDGQLQTFQAVKRFDDLMLTDTSGTIVYVTNKEHAAMDIGRAIPDPNVFEKAKDGIHVGEIFRNESTINDFSLIVAGPARDLKGRFIGVIVFEVDLDPLLDFIQETTGMGETGETLIGKIMEPLPPGEEANGYSPVTGTHIMFLSRLRHNPDSVLKMAVPLGDVKAIPMQEAVQGRSGSGIATDYRNKETIAAWRQIPFSGWGLVAKIDTEEAFVSVRTLRNITIIIGLLVLAAVILLVIFIARSISAPIRALQDGTEMIGRGDLDYKVGTDAKDEIGMLSRAFDRMTENLKTVTSSRDDLDREIGERKRAEEALHKHREQLEELVKKRTVELQEEVVEHRRAEEARKESENRFRDIAENAVVWIWEADTEGRYTYANPEVKKILGYRPEEVVGKHFYEFLAPEERDAIKEVIKGVFARKEAFLNVVSSKVRKDGVAVVCETSGVPILNGEGKLVGYRGSVSDITDRKRLEAEFLKAQKLESVGILAGGIAHDFNNILTGIVGNISLAKISSDPGQIHKRLTEAEKALVHANGLAQQLLTFSKGGAPVKEAAYIRNLIKDAVSFSLRGANVKYEYSIQEDLWPVDIDTGQIHQVISNMAINARHAMPEGGLLKIGAEDITIDNAEEDTTEGLLKEGPYIRISVEDNGKGIDREHLDKIFDPYFTTKEKGSGLGLAMSYSIIKRHGGRITVKSQVGAGTTFYIYLPASEKEVSIDKVLEETMTNFKENQHRGMKVLVLDDEEIVRNVLADMLGSLGYEVAFAIEGNEAIELYRKAKEFGKHFNAVIMDLTIPGGMGGREAIKKLLEIDPEAKAIVSSGYSNDPIMAGYGKYGFKGVIAKPYMVPALAKVLHEVIHEVIEDGGE
jgi:PAS domain S-box-containing protein